jgi:hypothetical protein
MSQHILNINEKKILCGYDKPLNYVFMLVFDKEDELLYSNINDENIDFTKITDFNYFVNIAKEKFDIDIPEDTKIAIEIEYLLS